MNIKTEFVRIKLKNKNIYLEKQMIKNEFYYYLKIK